MLSNYTHWAIGLISLAIWLFGAKIGIPPDAIVLAQATLTSCLGHALGYYNSKPPAG